MTSATVPLEGSDTTPGRLTGGLALLAVVVLWRVGEGPAALIADAGALGTGFFFSLTEAVVLDVFLFAGPACFAALDLPFSAAVLSVLDFLSEAAVAVSSVLDCGRAVVATCCCGGSGGRAGICIWEGVDLLKDMSRGLIAPDMFESPYC